MTLKAGTQKKKGDAYFKQSLYRQAIKDYDRALKVKPDYPEALNARGYAYRMSGFYEKAIRDFNASIRIKPNLPALHNRGDTYRARGSYDKALEDYNAVLMRQPDNPYALRGRGTTLLYYQKKPYEALADFEAAVLAKWTDEVTLYSLLWLGIGRTKTQQSYEKDFRERSAALNLSSWPGPLVSLFLGETSTDDVIAAAAASEVPKQKERLCEAYFYIGQYCLSRNAKDEAGQMFQKSLRTDARHKNEYFFARKELESLKR